MTSSILALLGLVLASASAELSSRIVRTKYGELSGVIVTLDRHLEGVEVFRGVPYASPPIGSLRFMPPVSGALWHGVKVADKFGPVCPQRLPELTDKMPKGRLDYLRRLLPYLRNQSEDCLYLNIYAPVQGKNFSEFPCLSCPFVPRISLYRATVFAFIRSKHAWNFLQHSLDDYSLDPATVRKKHVGPNACSFREYHEKIAKPCHLRDALIISLTFRLTWEAAVLRISELSADFLIRRIQAVKITDD